MTGSGTRHIFDFHTHVYPLPDGPRSYGTVKDMLRRASSPWTRVTQDLALNLRKTPLWLRRSTEELSAGYLLGHLFLEGSLGDLESSCEHAQVSGLLLVAHPPLIPNSLILKCTQKKNSWIPAWQYPFHKKNMSPAHFRQQMTEAAVRVLKIHPPTDGRGADDPIYLELLAMAEEDEWLVVLHSGRVESHASFKDPSLGDLAPFLSWFRRFPNLNFVVAHLNIHEPALVLEKGPELPNVWWTLSWQPEDTLLEALKRFPADRLLFASDWPLLGGNQVLQKERLEKALAQAGLSEADQNKVWSGNAKQILHKARAWKGAW